MFENLLGEGSIKMVDMYYRLVKAGLRPIEKVPLKFRDAVIADLTASLIDEKGSKLPMPSAVNLLNSSR